MMHGPRSLTMTLSTLMRPLLGGALMLSASVVVAAPILPVEIKLAPGTGGEALDIQNGVIQANKNSGPGNEQPVSTVLQKDGKTYVVTIYMSSNVTDRNNDNNAWQCKCGVVEIGATGTPQRVVYEKQLTQRQRNDATRPCNHPSVTTDGDVVIWSFGSDSDNNNNQVDTYAGILDHMCNEVQAPFKIEDRNGNNGAPSIVSPYAPGQGSYVMASYLNNGERTQLVGLAKDITAAGPRLRRTNEVTIVEPANIGRPTVALVDAPSNTYVACAAKGNQRPPEDGVACAVARFKTDGNVEVTDNVQNGNNEYGRLIAPSVVNAPTPQGRRYMNQPVAIHLGGGRVAVHVLGSDGTGRGNNNNQGGGRGTTHAYIYTLQVDPASGTYTAQGSRLEVTEGFQSHSGLCAAAIGNDPSQLHAMYVDAPITGSGLGLVTPLFFDRLTRQWTQLNRDTRPMGSENADSGFLQRMLGQNPNTSGRDFQVCYGDVPNPGARVVGGFRNNVDTFIAIPYVGRVENSPSEPKLGLYLSLLPGRQNGFVETPPTTSSSSSSASATASSSSATASSSAAASSTGGPVACTTGELDCACFPNDSCYAGLSCVSGLCQPVSGTSSSSTASSTAAASSSAAAASSAAASAASSTAAATSSAASTASATASSSTGGRPTTSSSGAGTGTGGTPGEGEDTTTGCGDNAVAQPNGWAGALEFLALGLVFVLSSRRKKA